MCFFNGGVPPTGTLQLPRAETIHRGFGFVRFVLLGSEFDSFSVFSVRSVSIFSHTYARSLYKLR